MINILKLTKIGIVLSFIAGGALAGDEVKDQERFKGSPEAKEVLLSRGFVVTDETYRQICSFYIHGGLPPFVTTDALLYAYYINVERSLQDMEEKKGQALAAELKAARDKYDAFPGHKGHGYLNKDSYIALKRKEWSAALTGVDRFLLVEDVLLKGRDAREYDELPSPVKEEIELIMGARGWETSPTRGIRLDYARFKPYGFYARSEGLERYYRAVTWFREVPFRVRDDKEACEAIILNIIDIDRVGALNDTYCDFLGPYEDRDICDFGLRGIGENFAYSETRLGGVEKTDEWRKLKDCKGRSLKVPRLDENGQVETEPVCYVLPRPYTFEAAITAKLTPRGIMRPLPSGEEFMAVLGSKTAENILAAGEGNDLRLYEDLLRVARQYCPSLQKEVSGYFDKKSDFLRSYDYDLEAMRWKLYETLLSTPRGENLPDYYTDPAWRYKDLNTCLAGWIHYRYLWDAHGKRTVFYGGLGKSHPGVVEPNRAFYYALLDLTMHTDVYFRREGVDNPAFGELAALLMETTEVLDKQLKGEALTKKDNKYFENFGFELANVCGFKGNSALVDEALPDTPFCVPIAEDRFTHTTRTAGQLRPRAIYVVIDQGGDKYLSCGGVLTYADFVGASSGVTAMDEKKWVAAAAAGRIRPPKWEERFSTSYREETLLEDIRKGILRPQMFSQPTPAMADILIPKIQNGDAFVVEGQYNDPKARIGKVRARELLSLTLDPRTPQILLPSLENPSKEEIDGCWDNSIRSWPEAAALKGRLSFEDAETLRKWIYARRALSGALIELMATVEDPAIERMILAMLDDAAMPTGQIAGGSAPIGNKFDFSAWNHGVRALLARPGLTASRELVNRLAIYHGDYLVGLIYAFEDRWLIDPYYDPETGEQIHRSFTSEEKDFVNDLRARVEEAKKGFDPEVFNDALGLKRYGFMF